MTIEFDKSDGFDFVRFKNELKVISLVDSY